MGRDARPASDRAFDPAPAGVIAPQLVALTLQPAAVTGPGDAPNRATGRDRLDSVELIRPQLPERGRREPAGGRCGAAARADAEAAGVTNGADNHRPVVRGEPPPGAHASPGQGTGAYRLLAKTVRPDRSPGDADAGAEYTEVDDAYPLYRKERGS